MPDQPGKRTGLYLRISDDREGRELGVARQEEDLRTAAAQAGDIVVDTYTDNDISASTRSTKPRPAYNRLLADARAGHIEKIWAYTSSRLTRRPMEHEGQIQLAEQHGVTYAYIRSPSFDLNTANGRMIARMLAAKDANESEETSERIQRKFQEKREKGEDLGGGRKFGWEDDGATPRPVEAAALAQACDDLLAGRGTYQIAAGWNRAGLLTSRGHAWTERSVRRLLLRPRNAGLIVHEGLIVGRYPWYDAAPVPEDTWDAVCLILRESSEAVTTGSKPRWLGTNLYLCWGCEQPSMKVGTVGTEKLYRCKLSGAVAPLADRHHVARQALALDAYVEELVVARLSRPDAVGLAHDGDGRPGGLDVRALRAERVTVRASLDRLDDDLDAGHIDRVRWGRRNTRLAARLVELDRLLAPVSPRNPFVGVADADDPAVVWFGSLPDRSDGLPLEQRRAIVRALMVVTILPVRRKRGPFDPSCVEVTRLR